jgi:Molybdopterin-binding domain of aldehyde dehydrogenase
VTGLRPRTPHALTREIRVPRIVGGFAAGRIMNTRTARSQYMGGMIRGISSALHEATEIDHKRARYMNDNLADYLAPRLPLMREPKKEAPAKAGAERVLTPHKQTRDR